MLNQQQTATLVSCVLLTVAATVIVGLRLWARRLNGVRLGADDYLAVATLIVQYIMMIDTICGVLLGGLGDDIAVVIAEHGGVESLLKCLVVLSMSYALASPLIKLTMLALYMRIFPSKIVRVGSYMIGLLVIGWCLAVELTTIFQCKPIRSAWDPSIEGKCIESIVFFTAISGVNVALDLSIILLPMPDLVHLNMSWRRRTAICGLFVLGGIVLVASILRLVTLYQLLGGVTNMPKQYVMPWLVGNVEVSVAIIGSCLPTLIPIFRLMIGMNVIPNESPQQKRATPFFNSIITIGRISNRKRSKTEISRNDGDGSSVELHRIDSLPPAESKI